MADAPSSSLSPPPAGLARRVAALLYDAVLVLGLLFAATLIVLPLRGRAFGPHDPWFTAYLVAVTFVFFGWCWTHGGQTLGMRAWRIRLVAAGGGPVSWRQAAIRFAAAAVSAACLGLGYLWMWVDSGRRTWPDLASETRVVRLGRD